MRLISIWEVHAEMYIHDFEYMTIPKRSICTLYNTFSINATALERYIKNMPVLMYKSWTKELERHQPLDVVFSGHFVWGGEVIW